MQARVRSQGFHASMSHLWNHSYFPTSHKVPDILIAGTTHQMPFVAEREILACEETVWAEYCTVKTLKKKKQTTGLTVKTPETQRCYQAP